MISALLVKVNIVFLFKFMIPARKRLSTSCPCGPFSGLSVGAILGGSLMARQTDIKRMLAYSTVAQVGYIFLGQASNETALLGTLYHVLNHAVVKGMFVLAAGSIMKLTAGAGLRTSPESEGDFPPMVAFTGALPWWVFRSQRVCQQMVPGHRRIGGRAAGISGGALEQRPECPILSARRSCCVFPLR